MSKQGKDQNWNVIFQWKIKAALITWWSLSGQELSMIFHEKYFDTRFGTWDIYVGLCCKGRQSKVPGRQKSVKKQPLLV